MGRPSKAANAQRKRRAKGHNIIIVHHPRDGWGESLQNNPKFQASINQVKFLEAPMVVKSKGPRGIPNSKWLQFMQSLKGALEPAPLGGWKVVFGFTHGNDQGKISFDPKAGDREDAHDWWTPIHHFSALYAMGIRRVHLHTCSVGGYLKKLPLNGVRQKDPLVVTAWDREIFARDDGSCNSDGYLMEGLPSVRSMRSSTTRRSWNALIEINVDSNGAVVSRTKCNKSTRCCGTPKPET